MPDLNNNSPIRMKSGIDASEVVFTVSRTEFANIGKPAGPITIYTPTKIAPRKAKNIGAPERKSANRITSPKEKLYCKN